jgi:hypothetical protein
MNKAVADGDKKKRRPEGRRELDREEVEENRIVRWGGRHPVLMDARGTR